MNELKPELCEVKGQDSDCSASEFKVNDWIIFGWTVPLNNWIWIWINDVLSPVCRHTWLADLHPARSHVTRSHEEAFLFQHQFNGVCVRLISLPGRPASCAAPRWTAEASGGLKAWYWAHWSCCFQTVPWCSGGWAAEAVDKEDVVGGDTMRCRCCCLEAGESDSSGRQEGAFRVMTASCCSWGSRGRSHFLFAEPSVAWHPSVTPDFIHTDLWPLWEPAARPWTPQDVVTLWPGSTSASQEIKNTVGGGGRTNRRTAFGLMLLPQADGRRQTPPPPQCVAVLYSVYVCMCVCVCV